jgi:hypothetical protein
MNNDYTIAIPSFSRSNILFSKTLPLLFRYNISKDKITIFLRDEQERKNYGEENLEGYKVVLTGCIGICETRNFLQFYYYDNLEYTNVLFIDDDIESIIENKLPIKDLDNFIKEAFRETKTRKFNIWGVSPFHNHFFMKDTITDNLKYVCGAFYGEIFDREKYMILSDVGHGEDFQKTMECFIRDNGVVRYNGIAIKTKYFGEGGINESYGGLENRQIAMERNVKYLKERYGSMCRIKIKDYGYDIRLNPYFKNKIE